MARRIKAARGKRITLPNGAVLSSENELVLSDEDFAAVAAQVAAGDLQDLGSAHIAGVTDVLTAAEHDGHDHTGLPGIPQPGLSVPEHAGIDHTGLPGIPGPSAFGLNGAGTIIVPADHTDSWVVGAKAMDRDSALPDSADRAFFDKTKRAFRAGRASGDHWDNANRGTGSVATGDNTRAVGGFSRAHGANSRAIGNNSIADGVDCLAEGNYSVAEGEYALAQMYGQQAYALGRFNGAGDAQSSRMMLRRITTDATTMVLTSDGQNVRGGVNGNVLALGGPRAWHVSVACVARRTDSGEEYASFTWEGLVAAHFGAARIIGTPAIAAFKDAAATDWTMNVAVDPGGGIGQYLAFRVTGVAGRRIQWVARAEWVEVG